MKANETKLLELMQKTFQFCIPIYQRHYSWTQAQCRQLYNDILRAGTASEIKGHFIGSIVYIAKGLSTSTIQQPVLVIDGQQRLTSCTLLLAALADFLDENQIEFPETDFPVEDIRDDYLINHNKKEERYYKLLLSDTDKETLKALISRSPLPSEISILVKENYDLFKNWISQDKENLQALCQGLIKLNVVDIALESGVDNPQLIFESMNSTGLALTQTDLIRNYILMGLEPELQEDLYQNYWQKIEQKFGQEAYSRHFNEFMRHYLTVKNGVIPNINAVYEEFKLFNQRYFLNEPEKLVEDIYTYADYYCNLVLNTEPNLQLKSAFSRLQTLKVDVAYPLLLQFYHAYSKKQITCDEMLETAQLIESYVFRRAICNIPTNSLNKTFVSLGRDLDKTQLLNHIKYRLLNLQTYRIFPNNDDFQTSFVQRDVYNFPRRVYLLECLENFGRKETINSINYTIEHIMPQNPQLSTEWQAELGENWRDIQKNYLHTIGNLTLTAYNSHLSDKSYTYKRNEAKDGDGNLIGLAQSPLYLNRYFIQAEQWNADSIQARAKLLAKRASEIWAYPKLEQAVLEQFKQKENQYDRLNQFNANNEIKSLFILLSNEIQNLDENISEELTKHYIGYNSNKRFVDIQLQEKSLKIVLNMPFYAINDPQNICKDMTNKGKLGNGDIQFTIQKKDEIPYTLQLINQSLTWNSVVE